MFFYCLCRTTKIDLAIPKASTELRLRTTVLVQTRFLLVGHACFVGKRGGLEFRRVFLNNLRKRVLKNSMNIKLSRERLPYEVLFFLVMWDAKL